MEAAIISAAVSIFVLVATQWVLAVRSRTEFLTTKVEELWQAIEDVSSSAIPDFASMPQRETKLVLVETSRAIHLRLSKPRMLCSLYFKSVMPHFSEFSTACGLLAAELGSVAGSQDLPSTERLTLLFHDLSDRTERLKVQLLEDYDALVAEPWAVAKGWWHWLANG